MIDVTNLTQRYKNGKNTVVVLKDINFSINKGECVIVKGVSGSGKSTLLSLLAGFEKPFSGAVTIEDEVISKLPDLHQSRVRNEKIGFVFQAFNLFEDLKVSDNVAIPTIVNKNKQDIVQAMQLANIAHKKDEIVKNLSGGEKQRASIARALVNNPPLLLCDEPTANLDKQNSQNFINIIKALKQKGKTILIATHDPLFESLEFVDRVLQMQDGTIQR